MFVHRSRFIEELADGLAELLRTPAAGADVFDPELVAIQGRGTERWLSMRLADALSVSANVEFPFPRQCVSSMLDAVLGEAPEQAKLFDTQQSVFVLARLLGELPATELGAARSYIEAVGDSTRLALARRVAGVFDQYAVYRPELLLRWDDAPEDDWQSALWHRLSAIGDHAHLPGRARAFIERMEGGLSNVERARLPRRVSFFGLTSLPPLFLSLLSALGRVLPVHLFLLSPSDDYWADMRSQRELLRERLRDEGADVIEAASGHPLLSELGRRSRDMQAVLEQHDDYEDRSVPRMEERLPDTLLRQLQDDMAALRDRGREPVDSRPCIAEDDCSIEVHSCHMASRELSVLRDRLLDAFARDPSLKPHEVVVMAPSIEPYAPLIEAVFGAHEERGRPTIPFRVADRAGRDVLPVLDSFFALTTFLTSRMRAPALLDLLRREPIAATWGITDDDLPLLTGWLASSGLRFAADAAHRRDEGLPESTLNTLRFGLDRLLLGVAVDGRDAPPAFGGHLPEPVDLGELPLLERLVGWLEALIAARSELRGEASCEEWSQRMLGLVTRFCAGGEHAGDAFAAAQLDALRSAIASVAKSAQLAGFEELLPVSVFLSELMSRATQSSVSGDLFGGGVTFCQLVPMRALPFRVVALIGMSDDGFPRRSRRPDFDRLATHPRLADPSPRDDDRQLFLEALLSARDQLILTYVGQSAQDNQPRPPSVLVSAMLDHLGGAYRFSGVDPACDQAKAARERLVLTHPLSPMSPRYFLPDEPRLFSYSLADCAAATAALGRREPPKPFLEGVDEVAAAPPSELTLSQLIVDLTRPASAHLRLRFGLVNTRDVELPVGEDPLALDKLGQFSLGQELLDLVGRGLSDDALVERVCSRGLLPHGNPGDAQLAELLERARAIHHLARGSAGVVPERPLSIDLPFGDKHLIGVCMQPQSGDRVEARFGKLRAPHLLRAWLNHLASCAAGGADRTRIVGADSDGAQACLLTPVDGASMSLAPLVELASSLHERPLPLFPEVSLSYVRARRDAKKRDDALAKARSDVEVSFVESKYRRADVDAERLFEASLDSHFDTDQGSFASVSEAVFGPLVDHLETLVDAP